MRTSLVCSPHGDFFPLLRPQIAPPPGSPVVPPQDLPSRPRRNRRSETVRRSIRENFLGPEHFILPIFVHEGA